MDTFSKVLLQTLKSLPYLHQAKTFPLRIQHSHRRHAHDIAEIAVQPISLTTDGGAEGWGMQSANGYRVGAPESLRC